MRFIALPQTVSLALVLGLAVASIGESRAGEQLNFFSTPGSTNYTSAGAPVVFDASYFFELGAFSSPFVPDDTNTEQWAENWVSIARTSYNPSSKWFTDSALLTSNAAPFGIGEQAYIWGFNGSGECILLKNASWTWPFAGSQFPTPGGFSFSVSDPGTTTIVGDVNGGSYQMMSASAPGEIPPVNPTWWLGEYFTAAEQADPDIGGWCADPDGDGADNITELAAGTDPQSAASVQLPTVGFVEVSGSYYAEIELLRSAKADIEQVLGVSADLQSWDSSGASTTVIEDSGSRLCIRADNAVGSTPREFYKFILTKP